MLGGTGRQAMGEPRRVLGILREEQESERLLSPQPGSVTWTPSFSLSFGAGPRHGLTVTYPTVGSLDALGSDVRLAIHRIVQEALTNTLKNAGTDSPPQ